MALSPTWYFVICLTLASATKPFAPFVRSQAKSASRDAIVAKLASVETELRKFNEGDDEGERVGCKKAAECCDYSGGCVKPEDLNGDAETAARCNANKADCESECLGIFHSPSDLFVIDQNEQKSMFVIDVSNSMLRGCKDGKNKKVSTYSASGSKMCPMQSMVDELKCKIDSLSSHHMFSIIAFAGKAKQLPGGWLSGSDQDKITAKNWIDNLKAYRGSRMDKALEMAAEEKDGKPDVIHIISDGLPTGGCNDWDCLKAFLCKQGQCLKVYPTLLNPNGREDKKYTDARDLFKLVATETGDGTLYREPFPPKS